MNTSRAALLPVRLGSWVERNLCSKNAKFTFQAWPYVVNAKMQAFDFHRRKEGEIQFIQNLPFLIYPAKRTSAAFEDEL
jgi:hypothetical protein